MSFRRNRRAFSLRPVRSNKEIVDGVFLNVAAGVITRIAVAQSVNDYTGAVGTCPIGSSIKAIYLEASYFGRSGGGRLDWYMGKSPGNNLTLPVPGATGGDDNRKWVFHESKGLQALNIAGSPAKKSGWLKIPGKMSRMGEDDRIELAIGSSVAYDFCLKAIYKWYA